MKWPVNRFEIKWFQPLWREGRKICSAAAELGLHTVLWSWTPWIGHCLGKML